MKAERTPNSGRRPHPCDKRWGRTRRVATLESRPARPDSDENLRGLAVRTKAVRHKGKNLREKAMPLKARGVNITRPRSFREPGPIEENHGFKFAEATLRRKVKIRETEKTYAEQFS